MPSPQLISLVRRMTVRNIDNSQRTAAKVAGFACLFAMAIVVYANYGIFTRLVLPGDAAETEGR